MDSSGRVNRLVAVAFLVSVLGGGAVAQVGEPTWADGTGAALERVVAGYNAAVDGVDVGPAARLVRDQRVTLTVTDTDGSSAQFSFRTDADLHVVDFGAGPRDDATVRMFTDPETVGRIAAAPDRAAAFESAVTAGDVRIEGVGLLNRAAWALVSLGLWAVGSPGQAVAVGAVALLGAGALAVAGTKVLGSGAIAAGSAGTTASGTGAAAVGTTGSPGATTGSSTAGTAGESLTRTGGNTVTVGNSLDPVSLADRVLSVFERALFIVAIAKKLGARLRRGFGSAVERTLGRFGFARLADDETPEVEQADVGDRPTIRRRGVPRRRRR